MFSGLVLVATYATRSCLRRRGPDVDGPAKGELPVLLGEGAVAPRRAHDDDAGLDLCAAADAIVPARGRALVKTGIRVMLPHGTYARVASRSGLSVKRGIEVGAGVIDAGYRGEIGVVVYNHTDDAFEVSAGDRIAQLIVQRVELVRPVVLDAEDWEAAASAETRRGAGGFGSTGV